MDGYQINTYGRKIADDYDHYYGTVDESCLTLLTELSDGGRVLELGIGTGRIALPLKNRGLDVYGIDAAIEMVEKMRAKPGGAQIPVTIGDFEKVDIDGEFGLIFVAFNTFFGLTTQDAQLRCMENVRRHLKKDGRFLIEAFVPDMNRFINNQVVQATDVGVDAVKLEVSRHDPSVQQVNSHLVLISENGVKLFPVKIRYVWPSEMDLMAKLAGLELVHRWQDWEKTPFSAESKAHISVYSPKR